MSALLRTLAAATLTASALITTAYAPPPDRPYLCSATEPEITELEASVRTGLNDYRVSVGLSHLEEDRGLNQMAAAKADDQRRQGKLSHTDLEGRRINSLLYDCVGDSSSRRVIGEILGQITSGPTSNASLIMQEWIRSDDHRQIIESREWTRIGIGRINGYYVVEFSTEPPAEVVTPKHERR